MRGEDPNTTINGPSAARKQKIEMAFRWRADDGLSWNAGLVAVFLWFFRGGGPDPMSPPPLQIRAWTSSLGSYEPTHMWDSSEPLFLAYTTYGRCWKIRPKLSSVVSLARLNSKYRHMRYVVTYFVYTVVQSMYYWYCIYHIGGGIL